MKQITKTYELFSYNELDEKAKECAVNWWLEASSGDSWWETIYEDAEQIGAKIKGFDCGRSNDIDFSFEDCAKSVAEKIIANHGDVCSTHIIAEKFLTSFNKDYPDDILEDNIKEFEKEIGQEYLSMLRKEYEYVNSAEYIEENIIANEYTFLKNGTRFEE